MKNLDISKLFTILLSAVVLVVLVFWFVHDPVSDLYELKPGMDNAPENLGSAGDDINIGSHFAHFSGIPSLITTSWPRFRGADFDNISKQKTKLAEGWGDGRPNELWSVPLGEGHAGPVVADGRVFLLDYDEENRRDLLRCFSLENGEEIWQRGYDIHIKRNHGMSRTVPAVQDSYVVSMGPMCQVMCVTADSGKLKWGIDVASEYKSEVPLWYTGQCPLIDDSVAVIAVGGDAMLIGAHLETGEVLWQTPNPDGWKMSHASIMPMTMFGKNMYVYSSLGGLVAVSADSGKVGEILFQTTEWAPSVIAPSPLHIGDGKIFVTAGYGAGSMMFQVHEDNGQWTIETTLIIKPDEGVCAEQQTPLLIDGHLISILPKDAGPRRNQLVCAPADDPANIIWTSSRDARFGLGPYFAADDKFFILSDDGELTIAKATVKEFAPLSQTRLFDGVDAWAPMALVDGLLLCRDSHRMVCVDVRAQQ
jgi:outer membrane protein assembly factor BamB